MKLHSNKTVSYINWKQWMLICEICIVIVEMRKNHKNKVVQITLTIYTQCKQLAISIILSIIMQMNCNKRIKIMNYILMLLLMPLIKVIMMTNTETTRHCSNHHHTWIRSLHLHHLIHNFKIKFNKPKPFHHRHLHLL